MSEPCFICETPALPSSTEGHHEERAVWFGVGLATMLRLKPRGNMVLRFCKPHGHTVRMVLKAMAGEQQVKDAREERPS